MDDMLQVPSGCGLVSTVNGGHIQSFRCVVSCGALRRIYSPSLAPRPSCNQSCTDRVALRHREILVRSMSMLVLGYRSTGIRVLDCWHMKLVTVSGAFQGSVCDGVLLHAMVDVGPNGVRDTHHGSSHDALALQLGHGLRKLGHQTLYSVCFLQCRMVS
jgi:hypothetical protein